MNLFCIFLRARDSARNEFQLTKTTFIVPKCSTNGITLNKPYYPHMITFFNRHKSFLICLNTLNPRVTIYRLLGTSRQLLAAASNYSTGRVEICLESQCKHVTLLLEPDPGALIRRAYYTYTFSQHKSK